MFLKERFISVNAKRVTDFLQIFDATFTVTYEFYHFLNYMICKDVYHNQF